MNVPTIPFKVPPHPGPISQARADLPPAEFRTYLRRHMAEHPGLTLGQVAKQLGLTRQRVHSITGPLGRPSCATPGPRPAPKRDQAQKLLVDLKIRVAQGEAADKAAKDLGISLAQAMQLGFRSKDCRPSHGTWDRAKSRCNCWRCRRVSGVALPRGPKSGPERKSLVIDLLAWTDPDDGSHLKQAQIARLAGVHQALVSRISREAS